MCRPIRPLAVKFFEQVDLSNGCWLWTGARGDHGYGTIGDGPPWVTKLAHRVSYELHKGPIPKGLYVLHTCDVRECVNPDHLYAGTPLDNVRDCFARGRAKIGDQHPTKTHPESVTRGERNAMAKLSERDVLEIRSVEWGPGVAANLAERFRVSRRSIRDARRGATWAHLRPTG